MQKTHQDGIPRRRRQSNMRPFWFGRLFFRMYVRDVVRVIYSDAEGPAEVATVDTVSSLIAWTDFCPFLLNVP